MSYRREPLAFATTLLALLAGFFHASLFGGKILSPGDVVFATASFSEGRHLDFEPQNRLLMDPVLQFQPWLEFNRTELRAGRLPLWNPYAGCGAPHLANGQSAVFDPFHLIAYLGRLPDALVWIAASRLFVAGFGMFLLARSWGYSRVGRWLSGLCYPFSGFLIVWLLYPVTSVAIWMPWLFLATDRVLDGSRGRDVALLALVVGVVLLAGHVQTSAHVLLAVGIYTIWRVLRSRRIASATRSQAPRGDGALTVHVRESDAETEGPFRPLGVGALTRWSMGIVLGIGLAAIEVVPLATYLSRSPVWSDRAAERIPILGVTRPRVLDAMTTAFPYLFGSQRRGHPNLAKALGVHNLNESAGGFAGLAALVLLAPAAWTRRWQHPRVRFLVGLGVFGATAAFGVFPVANLLRALPVLNVADNRRLTLWVAFTLSMLAGIGIDAVGASRRDWNWTLWSRVLRALAILFVIAAGAVIAAKSTLRLKAIAHYTTVAEQTPGADPSNYRERAERQVQTTTGFLPIYYLIAAAHLVVLASFRIGSARPSSLFDREASETPAPGSVSRVALVGLIVVDLLCFGYNLNPAIERIDHLPESLLIAYLKRECPPPARVLGIGAELPPNVLMRYGLADARNYDSVELLRSLDWFEPLYEPEPGRPSRTSRREIRWQGIVRARDRLRLAGVGAVVSATPPPDELFDSVAHVGNVWIGRWNPVAQAGFSPIPGRIDLDLGPDLGQVQWVAETFDPGWTAEIDGRPANVFPYLNAFLAVEAPPGAKRVVFRYAPGDVKIAAMVSLGAFFLIGILAGARRNIRKTATEAWKAPARRVRIEITTSARTPRPGSLFH
ncbi:MAG: hypothetical protein JWN86_4424 [Planctomycetota bacterium]|nr:hypothetical protein [Planctomycetota bacterium]